MNICWDIKLLLRSEYKEVSNYQFMIFWEPTKFL